MKDIDVLLEKYVNCECSLQEENQLKQMLSEQSDSKYEPYKEAFAGFVGANQSSILSKDFEKNLLSKIRYHRTPKFSRVFQLTSLSIAASIVLAVGFFTFTQKKEAYVIEQGVRYDDMDKAVGYADEAINEAIAPLKQSMQSLQPIKGLEGSLTPSFVERTINDSNLKIKVRDDSMSKTRN